VNARPAQKPQHQAHGRHDREQHGDAHAPFSHAA
jgi:hypothetical protein